MKKSKHSNSVYTSSSSDHNAAHKNNRHSNHANHAHKQHSYQSSVAHKHANHHHHHTHLQKKASKILKKTLKKTMTATLVFLTLFSAAPLTGFSKAHGHEFSIPASSHREIQGLIWNRVRTKFRFKKSSKNWDESSVKNNARVQKFVKLYDHNEPAVLKFANASPYLYYIIGELEKRNMPGELALLPMLESEYKPTATSPTGAAGLWQFTRGTGRIFDLKQDSWFDGRRDIRASTNAALNYLEYLHKKFNGDWMLALAAYNAGEGTLHKAIERQKHAGGPINFWSLSLPKETEAYVPKLLAMTEVVEHPDLHQIYLPEIENQPYFVEVDPKQPLSLKQVAKLAELDVKEVKCLNAAYKKDATPPNGPQYLLLPKDNATKFLQNLEKEDLS